MSIHMQEREGKKKCMLHLDQNMVSFMHVYCHHYTALKKQTMITEFPQGSVSEKGYEKNLILREKHTSSEHGSARKKKKKILSPAQTKNV